MGVWAKVERINLPLFVCNQGLPDFDGKKFQNVAKEGLEFSDEDEQQKEQFEEMVDSYKSLTDWLKDDALSGLVEKAVVSNRLSESPCALVAGQYGWWVDHVISCVSDVFVCMMSTGLATWNVS